MGDYTPTEDEKRLIAWLRRKSEAYARLGFTKEAFALREAATCAERGHHRHD
jgi:hypothetical protein